MRYLDIHKCFKNLKSDFGSVSFRFAIERNKMLIEPYYNLIETVKKSLVSEEYKSYDEARINFLREHCVKDANGEMVLDNGNLKVKEESTDLFYAFIKDHEHLIAAQNKVNKEFDDYLKKEVNIVLEYIPIEDVPDEIEHETVEIREAIFMFVK